VSEKRIAGHVDEHTRSCFEARSVASAATASAAAPSEPRERTISAGFSVWIRR
jgi:hypothetical protein